MKATSKLRQPLPSADQPLLRVRGRFLSDNADMPTMNMQISSILLIYYEYANQFNITYLFPKVRKIAHF